MFMEASFPRRPGDKARLYSERFQATSIGGCIKFWYHMYGASVGTLNVLVKTSAGNRSEVIEWTLSGNQLNKWNFGQAPVTSPQSGYQVGIGVAHIQTLGLYLPWFQFGTKEDIVSGAHRAVIKFCSRRNMKDFSRNI